jgi:hypothetical protein
MRLMDSSLSLLRCPYFAVPVSPCLLRRDLPLGPLDHADGDVGRKGHHQSVDEPRGHAVGDFLGSRDVVGDELQDDGHDAPDDRQAEGDADAVALDVLGGHGADLGAHGGPDQHDDGGHELGAALVGVGGRAVEAGDHDLEEVRAHGHVSRAAQQVDQGGHADQPAADAQDAGQPAGKEGHEDGQPGRAVDARHLEVHHGRDLDLVQGLVPLDACGQLVHLLPGGPGCAFLGLALGHVVEHHPGDKRQQDQVDVADDLVHAADLFQPHDHLGPDLEADHGAEKHDDAEFVVHVAELAVPHGRDQGFPGHVRDVRADGEGHGEAQDVQARRDHPRPAHAEESADDAHAHAEDDQPRPEYFHARDGHEDV